MRCSVCNFLCIGYVTLPNGIRVGFCFIHAYPSILSPNVTVVKPQWIIEFEDGSRKYWTFAAFVERVREETVWFKKNVTEN
jgi:hypothetical protein